MDGRKSSWSHPTTTPGARDSSTQHALAPGTELRVVAAPDPAYDPNSWWRTREGVKTFFYELAGLHRGSLGTSE